MYSVLRNRNCYAISVALRAFWEGIMTGKASKPKAPQAPTGYQKKLAALFQAAFMVAAEHPYGVSWGFDGKGFWALWERGVSAVTGAADPNEAPPCDPQEVFEEISERLRIALALHRESPKYHHFPQSPWEFAEKYNRYTRSRLETVCGAPPSSGFITPEQIGKIQAEHQERLTREKLRLQQRGAELTAKER
jgi:hypothetical protein